MQFLNVTQLISSAGGSVVTALKTLQDQGITDPVILQSVSDIGDSATAQSIYTDFLAMWGIAKLSTWGVCLNALFTNTVYFGFGVPKMAYYTRSPAMWCLVGVLALNTDVIASVFTGREAGVYEIGNRFVHGVGNVYNATQITRHGIQIGFLGEYHAYAVDPQSLEYKGFTKTDAFVIYNVDVDKQFQPVYGIESLHADGYTMVCLDANIKPGDIVKSILASEQGEPLKTRTICSSFNAEQDVDGALINTYKKKGHLTIPLLAKKNMAKELGIKVATTPVEEDVDDLNDDSHDALWEKIEQDFDALPEYVDTPSYTINGSDIASQGLFGFRAPVFGSSSIHKNADGTFVTKFISNYVNSFGPPVDYLASI